MTSELPAANGNHDSGFVASAPPFPTGWREEDFENNGGSFSQSESEHGTVCKKSALFFYQRAPRLSLKLFVNLWRLPSLYGRTAILPAVMLNKALAMS